MNAHKRIPALSLSLLVLAGLGGAIAVRAEQLLIENVSILSPERDAPLLRQQVLIGNGSITSISGTTPKLQGKVTRINGNGKYLTPGLMDSHVHVSMAPGLPYPLTGNSELQSMAADYTRQQPRSYLYYGITQLLDPANSPEAIANFRQQAQKPDLFRCGAAPVLNGYPTNFAPVGHRHEVNPDFIFDPTNSDVLPAGIDPAEHTPEAVVTRIKQSGALCVKVFIEDGFGDRHDLPIPSLGILARVRTAAHAAGMLLVAHANATDMQTIAVQAKVDVIAHGTWNWNPSEREAGRRDTVKLPQSVATLMQDIRINNIAYQPTLGVLPGLAALFKDETLRNPAYPKVVPTSLLQWYQTPAGAWFKNEMQQEDEIEDPEVFFENFKQVQSRAARALNYLYQLGQPILLASDTPSAPTYGNQPGLNTYQEMQHLADAGISLRDIFKAGTINNAKQFGLDQQYGTVQAGKIANLLLLNENPLDHLSAWDSIEEVIVHGKVIHRAALAANYATEASTNYSK